MRTTMYRCGKPVYKLLTHTSNWDGHKRAYRVLHKLPTFLYYDDVHGWVFIRGNAVGEHNGSVLCAWKRSGSPLSIRADAWVMKNFESEAEDLGVPPTRVFVTALSRADVSALKHAADDSGYNLLRSSQGAIRLKDDEVAMALKPLPQCGRTVRQPW
eukprot:TRINITY_DN13800_c0_g1_i2.p1 TRINITY_DN13800_c0_g1~~TRINITY_DN13800_c0_g1_i2.p1  ORF type:complete len:157 (+),score=16.02 TRINITY_DN13800_c0_g1_i2:65-535(+)